MIIDDDKAKVISLRIFGASRLDEPKILRIERLLVRREPYRRYCLKAITLQCLPAASVSRRQILMRRAIK